MGRFNFQVRTEGTAGMGSVGQCWAGQRGGAPLSQLQCHHPDPETPAAAEWIILESLLWCQLKMFESQIKVPAVPLPAGTQILVSPKPCLPSWQQLPAQVSLNPFCFIIHHPNGSRL